jgi:cytidine deaminase
LRLLKPRTPKPLTEFLFDAFPDPGHSGPEAGFPLDDDDRELVAAAHATLLRHYRPFWHTVSAALRGHDGRIWTGVHLGATVGRLSVCAEAIALGRAIMDGDGTVATAVALRHPKPEEDDRQVAIVSPCGACREMITDYAPDALVIVPRGLDASLAGAQKMPIRAMLPRPYRR